MVFLIFVNFLNYVDRGIISGAPEEFEYFIKTSLSVSVTEESTYLGLLASSFIVSYALCSVGFGHLVHRVRPFVLMGIGLCIWCAAVGLCGLAQQYNSYYMLLIGRALSGIGEASFQCIATPFIDDYGPMEYKALWLGAFFSAISVGTAVGFVYGAALSGSHLGWKWAFWIEMFVMLPLGLLCFMIPLRLKSSPTLTEAEASVRLLPSQRPNDDATTHAPTLLQELQAVLSSPVFVLVVLGTAQYTGALSAVSVFGSMFLLGFEMEPTETKASLVFGIAVVIAGSVGTPLGGILVDRATKNASNDRKLEIILRLMTLSAFAGASFLILTCLCISYRIVFLVSLGIGLMLILSTNAGSTLAVLLSVPQRSKPFAVALTILLVHAFGDVPSPVILGYLKDTLAPNCGGVEIDGKIVLNPKCSQDKQGLQLTLLLPILWVLTTPMLWGTALRMIKSKKYIDEVK